MDKSDPPHGPPTEDPTVKTGPTGPAAREAARPKNAPPSGGESSTPVETPVAPHTHPQSEPPQSEPHIGPGETANAEPRTTEPANPSPVEAPPATADAPQPAPHPEPPQSANTDVVITEPAPVEAPKAHVARGPRPLIERIDKEQAKAIAVRTGKVAAIVFCGWFIAVVVLIAVYRFLNPPFSTLMAMQWVSGTSIKQDWKPIEDISPNLVRAVITSEDSRFCRHWGIDFVEVLRAIERSSGGIPRGASTISMQVSKNLFLWPSKSYVRKAIEVPVTYAIEFLWPKRRIMEVYLNIAEWGPGVFGAEAASQTHFDRPASRLSKSQAARLAVALPNPISRDASDPGPWTRRRARIIQRRAAASPENAACVVPVR